MAWGGGNGNNVESWVKRLNENDPTFTSLHILSFRRISPTELGKIFEAMTTNTTLKEFYASGHALDQDSANKLSQALMSNKTLERLNIGNDTLGSQPDIMSTLARGIALNRGLVKLDLENKGLGGNEESVRALAAALGSSSSTSSSSSSATSTSTSTSTPTLQELVLARNKLSDKDIAILSQSLTSNSTLQKLDLCLNSFSQQGAQAIADYLSTGGAGGSEHQQQQQLKEIDLSDNEISEEGGVAIGRALAKNKTLERLRMSSVMDPPLPVEEGQEDFILYDQELEDLNKALTVDQIAELRSDGDTVLETIAESLANNKHSALQELWMDYCNITPVGAVALAESLRHNTSHQLKTIRMRNNSVGNRGARALGSALTPTGGPNGTFNSTLHSLELGENKIGVLGWYGLVGAYHLESLGLYANKIHTLHEALEDHQNNVLVADSPVSPIPSDQDNNNNNLVSSSGSNGSLSATVSNGSGSAAHSVLQSLVHLDVGCNGISREHFTQLGVSLIKGLMPNLIKLEIAGNGDRTETEDGGHGGHGGGDEPPEQDHEEEVAWSRVASRIEEARPNLAIHWKGGRGRE
ncbi:Leucine-rich repeat-containing protein 34 [Podila humilis]|nr:Leucine-rich repeat-containing protein 34 [Podila humilis]